MGKIDSDILMDIDRIKDVFVLAMDQHQKGDLLQAENAYRQIIEAVPDHAPSIHNLGLIMHQRGSIEQAIAAYRRTLAIAPDYFDAYINMGKALESQGRVQEAEEAYRTVVHLKPDYAEAYNSLGLILASQGHVKEAEKMYREAVRLKPGYAEAHNNLGNALDSQGRVVEAERAVRQALDLKPDFAGAYINLGSALESQGRVAEATNAYREALCSKPDFAGAYMNLGNALKSQGCAQESERMYRQALHLKPDLAEVYSNLVSGKKYKSIDHEDVVAIRALLNSPDMSEQDAMHLNFALGKIYDDCGAYDEAFCHYHEGNRIKHKTVSFHPKKLADIVNRVIETFDAEFLISRNSYGLSSEIPVFIVGMPRSGTTLVEQILASHPQVHGAGELAKVNEIVGQLPSLIAGNQPYPECVKHVDSHMARSLAQEYEVILQRGVDDDVRRVSDKMPLNFIHLGLIALLFPKAHIIHCQRHPLDVCLSVYFQYFFSENDYAYDLSDIGFFYRQYKRLMAHWRSVLPLKMHEIRYEELIADQAGETRALIGFLGLGWDQRCLDFFQNQRTVQTASSWQVRQPIYTTSVQRWRNYEKYLGPLKQSLGTETDMDFE